MFLNKEKKKKTVASKSWFIIQVPIISIIARDMEYTKSDADKNELLLYRVVPIYNGIH